MRKVLLFFLPVAVLTVLAGSFYLLSDTSEKQSVLAISRASAANRQKRVPRRLRLTPTPTPSPTKILIPTPTKIPTPTPVKTETSQQTTFVTPTGVPSQSVSTDSVKDYIMQKINEYRLSQGLSGVKTDSYSCDFAKLRAEEIAQNFNHDGFSNRINAKSLPYPSYHEVTENIAMTPDYKDVVSMWINSSGHAENMRRDTPLVCVERNGNYYAYEGWRP